MAIENTILVIGPRSSIVKDVFDCHLSSVILEITGYAIILGVRYSLGLKVLS